MNVGTCVHRGLSHEELLIAGKVIRVISWLSSIVGSVSPENIDDHSLDAEPESALSSEERHADSLSEVRILNAARNGDPEAFGRLVRQYQQEISRQMWRFTRDPSVHEELTHDVFVEAWMSLRGFRNDAPWIHWLRRIAIRVGYRFWKQQDRAGQTSHLTSDEWSLLQGQRDQSLSAIHAAELVSLVLAQLSPEDRLVLTITMLDGCTMAEAASRCGWTVTGTKVRAFRARRRLEALLQNREGL